MSLTMKKLMTALLLLLVIAQWNTASAQLSQMRLFSPPQSNQFGGNDRLRDGMYGEVSFNYWLITKGRDQTIGWVANDPGLQTPYYNSYALMPTRINTMTTGSLGNGFHGGTTLRVGKYVGHHGWEIKSTIMQAQRDSFEGRYGSMDIKGDIVGNNIVSYSAFPGDNLDEGNIQYYNFSSGKIENLPLTQTQIPGVGYFWSWFEQTTGSYVLAPMPITFERYTLDSKISHWDIEANYVFRTHATRIGFFEFIGGARYMQLDDSLTFNGWLTGRTTATEETTTGTGTGTGTTTTDTTTIVDPANAIWGFKAQNHLVGPQVGIRYIKKLPGRWSLIADTKFFAGFNTQNLKSEGEMGLRINPYDPEADTTDTGVPLNVPVGFAHNPATFRHSQTRTAFSPGIELGLKANWRLTDAIALNVGYQGMYLDRTARASLVNNYEIDSYGNLFGINGNVTQSTWMHGVNFELSINRF